MTERRKLKPIVIVIAAIAIIALLALLLRRSDQVATATSGQKDWFTIDDGKTWFADDRGKIPPFQKDGKTAYGCVVVATQDKSAQWVAYLFRFGQSMKSPTSGAIARPMPAELVQRRAMEVKRPGSGDTGWVSATTPQGIKIMTPAAKDGRMDIAPVSP